MKTPAIVVFLSWFAGTAAINAAEGTSAIRSLAALPPDAARRVAGIIGCEGKPAPERWRFLVWDPQTENGFREWVIEGGAVVAKNLVSQFASRVNQTDIIPPEAIQVDSDAAGSLALLYAKANNVGVSMLRYSLRRTPDVSGPVWKVDCFDEAEQQVGSISIAANEGKVLARLGFINEPGQAELAGTQPESAKRKSAASHRSTRSKPPQRRTAPPEFVAEQVRRATPVHQERRPFRLFRLGRD